MNAHYRDDMAAELVKTNLTSEQVLQVLGIVDMLSGRFEIKEKETSLVCYGETINYLATRFLASMKIQGYSDKTLYNKRKHLEKFFEIVPVAPADIKTDDIRSFVYLYQQKKNIKPASMNKIIESIKCFFRWAYSEEYISKDPAANVKAIKVEKNKPKKVLTSDELEAIRESAKEPFNHALVELLYSSGARINEISLLKWEDFSPDFKKATVFGKGSKYREIPINTRAKRALQALRETQRQGSPFVFQPQRDIQNGEYKPITTNSLRRRLADIKSNSGVQGKVTPHTFRRTMATNLLNASGDIVCVQKILGHACVNTTTLYAQISDSTIAANHAKFII